MSSAPSSATSSIDPFIQRKVVILRQDDTIFQAARAMCENRIGCVVVRDGQGNISGIVTDRDLVCDALASGDAGGPRMDTPLSEVMTPDPVCALDTAGLDGVVKLMEDNGIRRIPILTVGESGASRCVGIVSLDDLIVSQVVDYARVAKVVRAQVSRGRERTHARGVAAGGPAEERSEAHATQTLALFHKEMAATMKVDEREVAGIVRFLLGSIVQRLHYTGAAHFIAQLPHLLQEDLYDQPAGPNRKITLSGMLDGLERGWGMDEARAQSVLARFCVALAHRIDPHELEHVKAQLPEDLRTLFVFGDRKSAA